MNKRISSGWGAGEPSGGDEKPSGADGRAAPKVGLAVLGIAGAAAALWFLARRGEYDLDAEPAYKRAAEDSGARA